MSAVLGAEPRAAGGMLGVHVLRLFPLRVSELDHQESLAVTMREETSMQ